jgi:hypothetical protein
MGNLPSLENYEVLSNDIHLLPKNVKYLYFLDTVSIETVNYALDNIEYSRCSIFISDVRK